MPKFVGAPAPRGAKRIEDNAFPVPGKRVKLAYSQMRLLRARDVMYSLDTTDKGSAGCLAKRWYRWFSSPRAILEGTSTLAMREKARRSLALAWKP